MFEIPQPDRKYMKGRARVSVQETKFVPCKRDNAGDSTGLRAMHELAELPHRQARRLDIVADRHKAAHTPGHLHYNDPTYLENNEHTMANLLKAVIWNDEENVESISLLGIVPGGGPQPGRRRHAYFIQGKEAAEERAARKQKIILRI